MRKHSDILHSGMLVQLLIKKIAVLFPSQGGLGQSIVKDLYKVLKVISLFIQIACVVWQNTVVIFFMFAQRT